jgi:chromosome segregation ATPase
MCWHRDRGSSKQHVTHCLDTVLSYRVDLFDKKASEMESQLSAMQATSTSAADTAEQLHALQARHTALVAQHAAAVANADDAAAAVTALQAELDNVLAAAASTQKEAATHEHAADDLRGMVLSLQTRVHEYQTKDVEVYTRIREAMEVAEKVCLLSPACRPLSCALYTAELS